MQFPGTPVFFCAWQSSGVSECLCFGQTFTLMKVVTSFLQLNFTINSENIFFDSQWLLQKKTGRREKLNQVLTLEKWVCDLGRWIKRGNLTPLSLNTGSRIHLSVDVGFPSDHVVVTVSLSQPSELLKRTTAQKHVTSTLYNSSRTRCSTAPQSSTTSA